MKGYCKACKQNVEGTKPNSGSWIGVILFMIFMVVICGFLGIFIDIIIGIIIYFASCFAPKNICPICGLKIEK